jgi:hypothetical protein
MDIHSHGIIGAVIVFLIAWIVTSIPVWLASKAVSKENSFGDALIATLFAFIVYTIITFIFAFIGFPFIGTIVGIKGILAVFKAISETGWLGAIAIAVLAVIIYVIIAFIVGLFGIAVVHLF